ncbi:MAG: acyl carrier protein [Rhodobacter sp.]|nr:acyl carrier protein [Rhodobacter sp.]
MCSARNHSLEDGPITTEQKLIGIMERVVGVKNLSSDSRFLDIGGNSLNLVEVLKQVREEFGSAPSARNFFNPELSTVAALSAEIDNLNYADEPQKAAVNQ